MINLEINYSKYITIVLLIMTAFIIVQPVNISYAANDVVVSPKEIKKKAKYGDSSYFVKRTGKIIGLIRNFTVIIGTIILMILGVKYILGSAEQRAEYKKSLVPLAIGVIVVMSAVQITQFIISSLGK